VRLALGEVGRRRWHNFLRNRRAVWSLGLFGALLLLTLPAELVANDRPLIVRYEGRF